MSIYLGVDFLLFDLMPLLLYHLVDPSKAEDWYNSFLSDSNYAKNIVEMVKSRTIKEQAIDKNTLQLIDLITQMLNPNPKQRPHASQLLKHHCLT